jgi:hypothetical protein
MRILVRRPPHANIGDSRHLEASRVVHRSHRPRKKLLGPPPDWDTANNPV